MEYEGNTNSENSEPLESQESHKQKAWEKNFSKRWKQPTKGQLVEALQEAKHSVHVLEERLEKLEGTTVSLIAYINQRIP